MEVEYLRRFTINCMKYAAGFSGIICTGFDWPAILAVAEAAGVHVRPLLLYKLRILEDLAMKYFNKQLETGEKEGKAHGGN